MTQIPDLRDIQGNILHGYKSSQAVHLLLHAKTTPAARRCLRELAPNVTTAERWEPEAAPGAAVNVAVTHSGLQKLGVRPDWLAEFPIAFTDGPRQRAAMLGDVDASSPDTWVDQMGTDQVHLIVSVNAWSLDALTDKVTTLKTLIKDIAELEMVGEHPAKTFPGMREHFGFADGFSQPHIEGVQRGRREGSLLGGGVPLPGAGWRPLKLGEFILGYADEDGELNTEPDVRLTANGTYLVYRKLRQNVGRFREGLQRAADESGLNRETVAAKIVGRWRDGTPLELDPDRRPEGDLSTEECPDPPNNFRYLPDDREGYVCPRGAHIRRANPRDSLDFDGTVASGGQLTARHRIIRRGMPYGEPLADGAEDDSADRGLLFLCYNADIARQFEIVQGRWCNDGDIFGLGADRDFLLGDTGGTGKMTIPFRDSSPRFIEAQPDVVVTRGAEYLFVPGIRALYGLAFGEFA